jgi:hypothetical protein
MLHRILFAMQRPIRQKNACRPIGSFDVLESRTMLSGDPLPWIAPTDEGLPDATITPVEGPPNELTQEEIDACSGNWQSLTIRVYITDYFSGDVNGTLHDVAEFYQDYCVLITWEIVQIHTPPLLIFVPDDPLIVNAYDHSIAHEIGHLPGLPHAEGSDPHDIMHPAGTPNSDSSDLEDDYLTEVKMLQISFAPHLVPISDPEPTP